MKRVSKATQRAIAEAVLEPKHCDDYIDDNTAPAVLRVFLERARSRGHGMLSTDPYPKLFADYEGKRVRVTTASRFGDVGITTDLEVDCGYETRVTVAALTNYGDVP